jgi:hypothetical protein
MGRHQALSVWFAYLYLMGLNISNRQIADEELGLDESDGQTMADLPRGGIVKRRPKVRMKGKVWWNVARFMWLPDTRVSPIRSKGESHADGGSKAHQGGHC